MATRDPRSIVYQRFQGVVLADRRDGAARVLRSQLRLTDRIPRLHRSVPSDGRVLFFGYSALRWLFLRVEQSFTRFRVAIHACVVVQTYPLVLHELRRFSLLQG